MSLRCRLFGHDTVPLRFDEPEDRYGDLETIHAICVRCGFEVWFWHYSADDDEQVTEVYYRETNDEKSTGADRPTFDGAKIFKGDFRNDA